MISQKELKEILRYVPETGDFVRLVDRGTRARRGDICGSNHKDGYLHININNKHYLCHRLAFLYMNGEFPIGEVDHINHNRKDNRWENLRAVSKSENQKNTKISRANKSGVIGVCAEMSRGGRLQWRAFIRAEGRQKYLGMHDDKFEAICARKSAEAKYGFHENHGK